MVSKPHRSSTNPLKPPKTRAVKRPPPRPTKKGKERSQEDSIWKEILDELLASAMALLFPRQHRKIDWSQPYESLDKELVEVSEEGGFGKQSADKLYKVRLFDGKDKLLLLHIEVQAYIDPDFVERVLIYDQLIARKYRLPIDTFAILTDSDANYFPSYFIRKEPDFKHYYRFPMVKLLKYEQNRLQLEQSTNPFALVVLACLNVLRLKGQPVELKAAKFNLFRLLIERDLDRAFMLRLLQFIDGLTRLPMQLEIQLRQEVKGLLEEKTMAYVSSWEIIAKEEGREEGLQQGLEEGREEGLQQGLEEGREEGLQQGMVILTLKLLGQRFGPLEPQLVENISKLSVAQLESLGMNLLSFANKPDLMAWLQTIRVS